MIKENIYIFKKDYGICYTNNNLEYFIFDLEDYGLISERIWTRNKQGYFISKYRIHKNQILLHRLIMGSPKGMDIDHINGDKQDNRLQCELQFFGEDFAPQRYLFKEFGI